MTDPTTMESLANIFQTRGILAVVILILLGAIQVYTVQRIKSLAAKGVEEALHKHQKSLELAFSEDTVKNALKIEVGRKSIEAQLEVWENIYSYLGWYGKTMRQAHSKNEVHLLENEPFQEKLEELELAVYSSQIYLSNVLYETVFAFINAHWDMARNYLAFRRSKNSVSSEDFSKDYKSLGHEAGKKMESLLQEIASLISKSLYTNTSILEYEEQQKKLLINLNMNNHFPEAFEEEPTQHD